MTEEQEPSLSSILERLHACEGSRTWAADFKGSLQEAWRSCPWWGWQFWLVCKLATGRPGSEKRHTFKGLVYRLLSMLDKRPIVQTQKINRWLRTASIPLSGNLAYSTIDGWLITAQNCVEDRNLRIRLKILSIYPDVSVLLESYRRLYSDV